MICIQIGSPLPSTKHFLPTEPLARLSFVTVSRLRSGVAYLTSLETPCLFVGWPGRGRGGRVCSVCTSACGISIQLVFPTSPAQVNVASALAWGSTQPLGANHGCLLCHTWPVSSKPAGHYPDMPEGGSGGWRGRRGQQDVKTRLSMMAGELADKEADTWVYIDLYMETGSTGMILGYIHGY
jgi:hypothetical protein